MAKHISWSCDGCNAVLEEQPISIKITTEGNPHGDQSASFDLCCKCQHRVFRDTWPNNWARGNTSLIESLRKAQNLEPPAMVRGDR